MEREEIQREITRFLQKRGIPLAGVSAHCQIPSVPKSFTPGSILKTTQSIVCYGMPMPRGVIYAESGSLALYWRFCNMAYRTLDAVSNHLCLLLEQEGFPSSPIYGCYPWRAAEREFWGLLPLVYWGEQTGLGRITKCGLLANPIYGTRFLLGGLITALDLEPSGKLTDAPCPENCVDCIDACPVNAIGTTGKVDHNLCIRQSGSNPLLAHLAADPLMKKKFSFETMVNTVGVDDHGTYNCFKCLEVCPLNR